MHVLIFSATLVWNTGCPIRYRIRHLYICNEIWRGVRSLCEKWKGMCL